jgi:hypothetical protein
MLTYLLGQYSQILCFPPLDSTFGQWGNGRETPPELTAEITLALFGLHSLRPMRCAQGRGGRKALTAAESCRLIGRCFKLW